MSVSPIAKFRRWFADAERARVPLPEAIALATADARGRPSVRFVLLKHVDERGFVFFTDGRSRKGRELAASPEAALAVYWALRRAGLPRVRNFIGSFHEWSARPALPVER